MSRLQTFLTTLTDHELAAFFYYRYEEFIPASKEKICAELQLRGMPAEKAYFQFEVPAQPVSGSGTVCPRCSSNRFYTAAETETVNFSYASVDHQMNYKTCLICLYSADKESEERKLPVWNAFGFIRFLMNRQK